MNGRVLAVVRVAVLGLLLSVAVAGGLTLAATPAAGPLCTVDVGGNGADYATVAAAIGDLNCETISVAAGTYIENLSIDRDLVIRGAGVASTILDGKGGRHQPACHVDCH